MQEIPLPIQILEQITEAINNSSQIAIISHRNADPDTIGANLALKLVLESMGKTVRSYCSDPIANNYLFLPGTNCFLQEFHPKNHDLIITVDCASVKQTHFLIQLDSPPPIINFDHHRSNELFGDLNLVSIDHSSTCELIFDLFKNFWQIPFTTEISTLLLAGFYYDTGSFKHSNTNATNLTKAAYLMENGADLSTIRASLYRTLTPTKIKVWSEAITQFTVQENRKGLCIMTEDKYSKHQANASDLSGILDLISTSAESDYTLLLSNQNNVIRGSLRTNQPLNLIPIAQKFGGGGHRQACGFNLPGTLVAQECWKISAKE